jgi:hypothetical protein
MSRADAFAGNVHQAEHQPTQGAFSMYDVGLIAVMLACFAVIFAIFYGLEKI